MELRGRLSRALRAGYASSAASVDHYPLLFHTVFGTGGIEALVCLHIVENLVAVFEPDCLVVSVFVFVAGRAHPGGKVVEQSNELFRFSEAEECTFQISLTGRKLWLIA